MKKSINGKGGNIDTRPNPFRNVATHPQTRAEFASYSVLGLVIDKIISAGCGVILAGTRDGGALVITVLDGDTRHRTYCSNDTELEEALDSLNDYYSQ